VPFIFLVTSISRGDLSIRRLKQGRSGKKQRSTSRSSRCVQYSTLNDFCYEAVLKSEDQFNRLPWLGQSGRAAAGCACTAAALRC
jgi:hypothetical protein